MATETISASQNSPPFLIGPGETIVYRATLASGSSTLTPKISSAFDGTFTGFEESGTAVSYTASSNWKTVQGSSRAPMYLRFENGAGGAWSVEVL